MGFSIGWRMAIVSLSFFPIMVAINVIKNKLEQKWEKKILVNNIDLNGTAMEVF